MECLRRVATGRMSEMLGKKALIVDRYSRTIGWKRQAESKFFTIASAYRNFSAFVNSAMLAFWTRKSCLVDMHKRFVFGSKWY